MAAFLAQIQTLRQTERRATAIKKTRARMPPRTRVYNPE